MNPAVTISQTLEAASVGTRGPGSGWRIFIAKEPATPDTAITVYNTGGRAPHVKLLIDWPSVQVRVRGAPNGYETSRAKAQEVKDKLLGKSSYNVEGGRVVSVSMMGDILDLGFDDNQRPLHVVNFNLILEPASAGSGDRIPL